MCLHARSSFTVHWPYDIRNFLHATTHCSADICLSLLVCALAHPSLWPRTVKAGASPLIPEDLFPAAKSWVLTLSQALQCFFSFCRHVSACMFHSHSSLRYMCISRGGIPHILLLHIMPDNMTWPLLFLQWHNIRFPPSSRWRRPQCVRSFLSQLPTDRQKRGTAMEVMTVRHSYHCGIASANTGE